MRVGAFRAPRFSLPKSPAWLKRPKLPGLLRSGAVRKTANIAAAAVLVTGAGMGSALFVDYLAERAVVRAEASSSNEAAPARVESAVAKAVPVVKPAEPEPVAASEIAPPARVVAGPAESAPVAEDAARESPAVASETSEADEVEEITQTDERLADRSFTAAIGPRPTEPEPAPLPVITAPQAADGVGEQAAIAAAEITEETTPAAEPTRAAKVTEYVNLRAGPNDESKVLTVVPAKETVQIVNCDGWCEVDFKGQKGFIYKSFIDG